MSSSTCPSGRQWWLWANWGETNKFLPQFGEQWIAMRESELRVCQTLTCNDNARFRGTAQSANGGKGSLPKWVHYARAFVPVRMSTESTKFSIAVLFGSKVCQNLLWLQALYLMRFRLRVEIQFEIGPPPTPLRADKGIAAEVEMGRVMAQWRRSAFEPFAYPKSRSIS